MSDYGYLKKQAAEIASLEALRRTSANRFGAIDNRLHGLQVEHQSLINQNLPTPDPLFPPPWRG
jgi:hypothetical protein